MCAMPEEAHAVIFGGIPKQVASRHDDGQKPVIDRNGEYNRLIIRQIGSDFCEAEQGRAAQSGIFRETLR